MDDSGPHPSTTRAAGGYEPVIRLLIGAGALVVIVAGLRAASAVLIPFLLALFLAILSLPLLEWLRARGVPRLLAVLLTLFADMAVLVLFGWALGAAIQDVTRELPRFQSRFGALVDSATSWLEARGFPASDWIAPSSFRPSALVDLVSSTFVGVATFLTTFVLVLLLVSFMLVESWDFAPKLRHALRSDGESFRRYAKITGEVQRYLVMKTVVSLATGVSASLWVALVGLEFPVFWGFIAFLFNYVPNIGSIVAAVPATIFALVQLGPTRALIVAVGYVVINLWWGNIVEPGLMGRRLRLSPLAVLVSLVFWGWVWGPMGMLLSVPLTMVLKILFENSPSLVWLAAMLEQAPRAVKAAK